jgi:hypothetical protein
MLLHDYVCKECGTLHADCLEKPECCGEVEITFANWKGVAYHGTQYHDSLGRRKAYGVIDDPLARIELQLDNSPEAAGVRTLSNEAAAEFRGRLESDGDSPKLRTEILEARKKAE